MEHQEVMRVCHTGLDTEVGENDVNSRSGNRDMWYWPLIYTSALCIMLHQPPTCTYCN